MPTDNPKVSAYVPQSIKDRLKAFREERDISESQALILILAEYFGMPEALVRSHQGNHAAGVTLARIEVLEEKLASLTVPQSSLPSGLLEKIDQLSLSISFFAERLEALEQSSLLSELKSELKESDSVLPQEDEKAPNQLNLLDLAEDGQAIRENASSSQWVFIESDLSGLPDELLEEIKPISASKLSTLRFKLNKDTVSKAKGEKLGEAFIEWTRKKDPDGIAWKYVELPSKGYLPAHELSSELKSRLLVWIEENLK